MREVHEADLELLRSSLSHDVAAVLRTISSTLSYVDGVEPGQRQELIQLSRGSIEGVERVARQLLDLLVVVDGAGPGVTDLDPLVAALVHGSAGGDIEVGRLGAVAGPERLWRVVVGELIDNARRFGAPPLRIHREADVLVVSDAGPGIADEARERAFEAGTRFGSSDGHPGAGLGLHLARRAARLLGGDVRLEPADPTGTRAVVRLPSVADTGGQTGG